MTEVAVLGGTGRTGRLLIAELLRRGHRVTALVRDPGRLGDPTGQVRVVTGDSRDRAALADLLEGAQAVMSALGPSSREPHLHRDTATALVAAMTTAGTRRFIGISAAGIDVPGDQKSTRDRVISGLMNRLGGALAKDKPAEYRVWAASNLDWTLVRPPRLRDGPATGTVEHDPTGPPRRPRCTEPISPPSWSTFLNTTCTCGRRRSPRPSPGRSPTDAWPEPRRTPDNRSPGRREGSAPGVAGTMRSGQPTIRFGRKVHATPPQGQESQSSDCGSGRDLDRTCGEPNW